MNKILTPLAATGLLLVGSYVFADDEISQAGMVQQQKMMKDCMAKHASEGNGMTKSDMEKACKEEMKPQKENSNAMSGSVQK